MLLGRIDHIENQAFGLARPAPRHPACLLDIHAPALCRPGDNRDLGSRFVVAFVDDPTRTEHSDVARVESAAHFASFYYWEVPQQGRGAHALLTELAHERLGVRDVHGKAYG